MADIAKPNAFLIYTVRAEASKGASATGRAVPVFVEVHFSQHKKERKYVSLFPKSTLK